MTLTFFSRPILITNFIITLVLAILTIIIIVIVVLVLDLVHVPPVLVHFLILLQILFQLLLLNQYSVLVPVLVLVLLWSWPCSRFCCWSDL